MNTLSPEEMQTYEAYKIIAQSRNSTHANPEFWRVEFEQFRKFLPSGRILDVGCGAGRDALLFTNDEYQYVGIDQSAEMLTRARELVPGADFRQMNMYTLDFPVQSLDGFWAAESLLHIPKHNVVAVLSGIRNVIRPGGIGFIAIKEGDGEKIIQGSPVADRRFFAFYQPSEFRGILTERGFDVLADYRAMMDYNPPKNLTIWLVYFVRVS